MAFASTGFLIFLLVGVIVYYLIPKKFQVFPHCCTVILGDTEESPVSVAFSGKLLFLYVFGCKNARVDYYDDNNNIFGRNMA